MPFHIGSGCLPATISNRRIYRIAWSDTPPEMSSWEKMKEFFCSTHQTEALECIWNKWGGYWRQSTGGGFCIIWWGVLYH